MVQKKDIMFYFYEIEHSPKPNTMKVGQFTQIL